jgi:hypothetical protein
LQSIATILGVEIMLFYSSVPEVFRRMNLQADSASALARKQEAAKRLNFYHDEQLTRLEEQLNQLFSDPSAMIKTTLNIVKKVINNLSQVYREPPSRAIEGTEKDQELYNEIVEGCALDVRMKQASRYCKLLKTILLRPIWRNEKLDVDIITGNICDVVTGDSPEILEQVLITDYGTTDKVEDVTFSHWTPETWTRLDYRGNVLEQAENPYRILPFLPIFDYPPPSSAFWLPGGSDLISLQESINLKLTDLLYLISQQSFGVGWIRGAQAGGSVKVDPGTLVELPENGALGFESQKAEIGEVVNAIDKLVKWACVSNGLSAGSMSTDPSEASGLSKIVDTRELSEMRQDDIALWRSYEKQLFNLMRTIYNAHSSKKLSESATLKIDLADPKAAEVDPLSQAKSNELLVELGVISPVDVLLEMNTDLQTREDALAHLLKVKEENKLLTEI